MYLELENEINKRMELLNEVIIKAEAQMPNVQGRLRIGYTGRFPKYYHIKKTGDKQGKYIRKKESALINALAQKGYDENIIILAQEELKVLKKMISIYPDNRFDNYMDSLADARKERIDPIWIPDDDYVKQWLNQEYRHKGFSPYDTAQFITNDGLRVRSKSEVNIANSLDKFGLPFIYELPLYLKNYGLVHPDFAILLIKTRKVIFWEHHGMLDDKNYRENSFLRKTNAYMKNGYFPGKNLIQTFESQTTPLSIPVIDAVIREYLI